MLFLLALSERNPLHTCLSAIACNVVCSGKATPCDRPSVLRPSFIHSLTMRDSIFLSQSVKRYVSRLDVELLASCFIERKISLSLFFTPDTYIFLLLSINFSSFLTLSVGFFFLPKFRSSSSSFLSVRYFVNVNEDLEWGKREKKKLLDMESTVVVVTSLAAAATGARK